MGNQNCLSMQYGTSANLSVPDQVQHKQVISACNSLLSEKYHSNAACSNVSPTTPFNAGNMDGIAVQDAVTPASAQHVQIQGDRMIGDIGAFPTEEMWEQRENRMGSPTIQASVAASTAFSATGGDGLEQCRQAIVLAPNLQVPVLGASPCAAEPCLPPSAKAMTDQREMLVEVVPQQPAVPGSEALSDLRPNLDSARFLRAPDSASDAAKPYHNPFRPQMRDD